MLQNQRWQTMQTVCCFSVREAKVEWEKRDTPANARAGRGEREVGIRILAGIYGAPRSSYDDDDGGGGVKPSG